MTVIKKGDRLIFSIPAQRQPIPDNELYLALEEEIVIPERRYYPQTELEKMLISSLYEAEQRIDELGNKGCACCSDWD
jgi:hypothetical protein